MTPALARAILLQVVVAWLGVLALALARDGARGLRGQPIRASRARGTFHAGAAARRHGAVRFALGCGGIALVGWLLL